MDNEVITIDASGREELKQFMASIDKDLSEGISFPWKFPTPLFSYRFIGSGGGGGGAGAESEADDLLSLMDSVGV